MPASPPCSRSTIAALVVAIAATTIEQAIGNFGPALSLNFPSIVWPLYHVLPGHHLANLSEYIREGAELKRAFPDGRVVDLAWTTSLAVLAAWIGIMWGASFAAFRRQDIN